VHTSVSTGCVPLLLELTFEAGPVGEELRHAVLEWLRERCKRLIRGRIPQRLKVCHVAPHLIRQCRIAQILHAQLPHTLIDSGGNLVVDLHRVHCSSMIGFPP
jgi:hypothetical protein